MLESQSVAILFCDRCEAVSARTEHGWRGYRAVDHNGEQRVVVLCPICSEYLYGEDEEDSE